MLTFFLTGWLVSSINMNPLLFDDPNDLEAWLISKGIFTNSWRRYNGKSLTDLWTEYNIGETIFQDDPPMRLIEVAEIIIRRGNTILIELEQEFADGRRRARLVLPSEKLKSGEAPRHAALRCLREELGLGGTDVTLREEPNLMEGVADSPSYPGLQTHYRFYTFEATTDALPDEDFYRDNAASGDPIRCHRWGWRKREN